MNKFKLLLLLCIVSGCASQSDGPQPIMPQNDPVAPKEETPTMPKKENDASIPESIPEDTVSSLKDTDSIANQFYLTKAENEILELDEELLEIALRIGTISKEEFNKQKLELEALDEQMDVMEDDYETQLKINNWNQGIDDQFKTDIQNIGLDECLEVYSKVQEETDALDNEKEELKQHYLNGEITREDALVQWTELEKNEDLYDEQEDLLEQRLEMLGFDD